MILKISDKYRLDTYNNFENRNYFEDKYYIKLRETLDSYYVDRSHYSLNSPDAVGNGNYCLHFDDGFWVVYVAERGERLNPAFFSDAWGAANFLLWNLLRSTVKHEKFPIFKFDPFTWS